MHIFSASAYPDTSDFNNRQPPPSYQLSTNPYPQPQYAQPQYTQAGFVVQGVPGTVVGTTVVGTGVVSTVIMHPLLGPKPTAVTCRACNQQIVTRVDYTTSMKTHLLAGLLCLVG